MQLCAACEPCFHTTLKLMETTRQERPQSTAQERLIVHIYFSDAKNKQTRTLFHAIYLIIDLLL